MRILMVSTLKRKVSPEEFSSRSRIIYELAEGFSKKGHEVSLLGTGDSYIPGVSIIPITASAWEDLSPAENVFSRDIASLMMQARSIVGLQGDFDIIHNHSYPDFFPLSLQNELKIPIVTTLHAVYEDYIDELLSIYDKSYLISLSEGYKKLYKKAKITEVIYNGTDVNLYKYSEDKSDYLLWIGRLARGKNEKGEFLDPKGVRWAIRLAVETGSKLKLAGTCEDDDFFNKEVVPYLSDKIEWVGEHSIDQSLPVDEVVDLMQYAKAFLMTVNQEEPFGLVMAEAMACGTPVIGFDRGSVSEVIENGKTGFVVDPALGTEGLKEALSKIGEIKPRDCRDRAVAMFSVEKMVDCYEKLFFDILKPSND